IVYCCFFLFFFFSFFFFSSRRRHTRFSRDWSSDVCSSDLVTPKVGSAFLIGATADVTGRLELDAALILGPGLVSSMSYSVNPPRSEERRVGKECRSRWLADQ